MSDELQEAVDILREFVQDVKQIGGPKRLLDYEAEEYWPDLEITYQRARALLRQPKIRRVRKKKNETGPR